MTAKIICYVFFIISLIIILIGMIKMIISEKGKSYVESKSLPKGTGIFLLGMLMTILVFVFGGEYIVPFN